MARNCPLALNFWIRSTTDIDDFRVIVQHPTPRARARFSVRLCGSFGASEIVTCSPTPEGWPIGDAVFFDIGNTASSSVPDDGDLYAFDSSLYGDGFVKLVVKDFDIEEVGCGVQTSPASAPAVRVRGGS